ncbi:MAG: non-canonical purine NTP pyrophosphatase [Candidatus Woesebacteria bacterium]|jgi:non-canonical purine NTP pyrophosphatase (RdgB/HAM1 family)
MQLTFITGNPSKASYVADWLNYDLDHHNLDLAEIQSLDLREVVEDKAKRAYDILQKPVLVEDVSLTFDALGRLPGTYVKWFIQEAGLENLCRMLDSHDDRSAMAKICYAIYDGQQINFFEGQMTGRISMQPMGDGGFGFDPIFINDGYNITRAQMQEDEFKNASHRYEALTKLSEFLHA